MKKRWTIDLIPYEEIFALDNEAPNCLTLTEQQIGLLLAQIQPLFWASRYEKDDKSRLNDEQYLVITKAAEALQLALTEASGCMAYTIEFDGCNLVLKSDGTIVSTVDLSTCLAPPIHIAFDAQNCRLMYTQGNIYSPYTGGDWISVIDFTIADLRECLAPPQQPPSPELMPINICDIATGTADLILADVLFIMQLTFAALTSFPYTIAMDVWDAYAANYEFRRVWSILGIANYVHVAPIPDQPMLDTLESVEAHVQLAQHFYCSMSLTPEGNIFFDYDKFKQRVIDNFFSVNMSDAILSYIEQNFDGDLLREYFFKASFLPEYAGSDCSAFDCYQLTDCIDYSDEMQGGLGIRTRLFDAAHDFASNGGVASGVIAAGGIAGGVAVAADYGGTANFTGGFYVDLGRDCTVNSAFVWFKNLFNSTNYPTSIDVDYYSEAMALRHHFHDPVNFPDASTTWRQTGYNVPVSGVRYIAFLGGSSKFSGAAAHMYLANPTVDVVE